MTGVPPYLEQPALWLHFLCPELMWPRPEAESLGLAPGPWLWQYAASGPHSTGHLALPQECQIARKQKTQ